MGLKCSFLGHVFEPAGVERDHEDQGSEVVTVVRELEACARCGEERVVSESTEVTAAVEPDEVGAGYGADDAGRAAGDSGVYGNDPAGGLAGETSGQAGGAGGSVDSAIADDADDGAGAAPGAGPAVDEGGANDSAGTDEEFEARNPEEEDAEILTDDEPGRQPGEWPDDPEDGAEADEEPPVDFEAEGPDEESLSGITVPEGRIVCPECGFEVDAESSYRNGDPCPECGAWLTTEGA